MDIWYRFVEALLPFDWARFTFMKNALLAVILVSPLFALIGTAVVGKRMVFFSEVLGHSALTGVAIGVIMGLADPQVSILGFAVLLAVAVNVLKLTTNAASDTVLGVLMAVVVAVGVVILSAGRGFGQYTSYLIGDILAVTPGQIARLALGAVLVLAFWAAAGNALVLTAMDRSLGKSRGLNIFLVETVFSVVLAVVVTLSIRLVGILIINSLLVLPAAAARTISSNMKEYTLWSVLFSVVSGICGLIASYYWGTASAATIVLFAAFFYASAALIGIARKRRPAL
ncbi:MAG: metal ABC transporter permease [Deltaproteobacteria bacterium]